VLMLNKRAPGKPSDVHTVARRAFQPGR